MGWWWIESIIETYLRRNIWLVVVNSAYDVSLTHTYGVFGRRWVHTSIRPGACNSFNHCFSPYTLTSLGTNNGGRSLIEQPNHGFTGEGLRKLNGDGSKESTYHPVLAKWAKMNILLYQIFKCNRGSAAHHCDAWLMTSLINPHLKRHFKRKKAWHAKVKEHFLGAKPRG